MYISILILTVLAQSIYSACTLYCGVYWVFYCVLSFHLDSSSSTPIAIRSVNGQALHQLYVKFQPPGGQAFLPTNDFGYVVGLNQAFSVTQNTLFRITFQGSVYNRAVIPLEHSIQIMVNDLLIIGNKTIPNTSARLSYTSTGNILEIDNMNGFYQVDTTRVSVLIPITRIAYIYLAPGVYSFNIGARTRCNTGYVYDGTVTYELIQSSYPFETSLGQFQLITNLFK